MLNAQIVGITLLQTSYLSISDAFTATQVGLEYLNRMRDLPSVLSLILSSIIRKRPWTDRRSSCSFLCVCCRGGINSVLSESSRDSSASPCNRSRSWSCGRRLAVQSTNPHFSNTRLLLVF